MYLFSNHSSVNIVNVQGNIVLNNIISSTLYRKIILKIEHEDLPQHSIDKKLIVKRKNTYNPKFEFELNHKIKKILSKKNSSKAI